MDTTSLTAKQSVVLILYGVILWFVAASLVRVIGPMGAFDGVAGFISFALIIPGTVPAIYGARCIAKLQTNQTAAAILIVTAAALLLDGIAHAWFPKLYGTDPALIIKGAAAIFWGAGVGLVLGLVMNKPSVPRA